VAPAPQDPPAGVEPVGEGAEPEGPLLGVGGHRVDAEPSLGDDAEGALAAHEELVEVGTGGRAGTVAAGADDRAVGQDDLQADDHVLDLAVAVGVLAGPAAGQPSAHGGEVHRLGPVAERHVVVVAQPGLHVGTEGAGAQVGHQGGGVDMADPGQAAEVEDDPAVEGDGGAADTAAPGRGGHRDAGVIAGGEHG